MKPQALILRAAGTNCDVETARGFELAGAEARLVHVNRLLERPQVLKEFQILAIPGGFSYGDDIAAGKILASQLVHHLSEPLQEFVSSGKPIIGICNGFQVLVKTKLLPGELIPGRSGQLCTLTTNDCGRYLDRWVTLAGRSRKCIWTAGIEQLALPVGHGEGKFVPRDSEVLRALWERDQVALAYTRPDGEPARGEYPHNPNGSVDDIAGICDHTGLVLGLMPHPDRHLSALQHPAWTARQGSTGDPAGYGPGVQVFAGAVEFALSAGIK
jgi:phosphoribosylformylglycinamidine synthase